MTARSALTAAKYGLAALAFSLAACSGNFSSGTGMPGGAIPPVGPSNPPPYGTNGIPQNPPNGGIASASPAPTFSPGTYAAAAAQAGFACPPTTDGFGCTLRFNLPPPTPVPSASPASKSPKSKTKSSEKATMTPSPTPSPAETPSATPGASPSAQGSAVPSESPSPNASASPGKRPTVATVSLKANAMPKDAPAMYHTPPNTLDVVPLMMVTITPNADFDLDGNAEAQFTLPKSQLDGRGFAVQLFKSKTSKKKTEYLPIYTFDKSNVKDGSLVFDFTPPKLTIPKGGSYVLVLYGDDKSKVKARPSSAASAAPAPTATASASASPAATATPQQ